MTFRIFSETAESVRSDTATGTHFGTVRAYSFGERGVP
jgi:hypothetical protein